MLSLPLATPCFAEHIAMLLSVSELHQTWSSFQCSVVVTDIFLAPKSSQTRKNMLLKETDTIDAILTVVLEPKHVCNPNKLGAPVAMFGFSFVTSVFRVTDKPDYVTRTFRGKDGFTRDHVINGGDSGKRGGTLLGQLNLSPLWLRAYNAHERVPLW